MSERLQLRVQTGPRDHVRLPSEDDALGDALFAQVKAATERGLPRPAMLVLDETQVRQFDAVPLLQRSSMDRGRLLAAVGGQPDAECAALAGSLTLRMGQRPTRAIVVYLEWPDNRWWTAWQVLDDEGRPAGDGPQVRRAVDGAPRPGGLGGWFSRTRREGLRLKLEQRMPPGHQAGLDLVH